MHKLEAIIRHKWNTLYVDDNSIRVINGVAMCYTGKSKTAYVYTRPSNRQVQYAWIRELSSSIDVLDDNVISSGTIPMMDFIRHNQSLET